MLITSPYLIRKSGIIKSTLSVCSHRFQTTDSSSLASILFPEPKPLEKDETSPTSLKPTTKQQAQAVVSSAADAAVNALGVGWSALNAVSNRITGLTAPSRTVFNANEQLKAEAAAAATATAPRITPDSLQQRTISLIRSVRAASSSLSQATRIEELANHLLQHPDANYFTKKVSFTSRILPKMKFDFFQSFRNV